MKTNSFWRKNRDFRRLLKSNKIIKLSIIMDMYHKSNVASFAKIEIGEYNIVCAKILSCFYIGFAF
jgi:hypothetical protein